MPTTDLKKTLTDTGYIAIGLGVMGFQQAQSRARDARQQAENAGSCLRRKATETQTRVQTTVQSTSRAAKDRAETQLNGTVTRIRIIRVKVTDRVEPTVGRVQAQLGDLPERVVQAMEPVAARVREFTGSAA
jgi:hypothetical protein